MGNFDFIKTVPETEELQEYCKQAERTAQISPKLSVMNCRWALEWMVIQLLQMKDVSSDGLSLSQMIDHEAFRMFIGADPIFWRNIKYVRTMGNRGAHIEQDPTKRITPQQALYTCCRQVLDILLARHCRTVCFTDTKVRKNPCCAVA